MSIVAIIHITSDHESPQSALDSIYKNREYVSQVIVVYPTIAGKDTPLCPERWDAIRTLPLQVVPNFTPDLVLNPNHTIAEIPPCCTLSQGAFGLIQTTSKELTADQTQFGITTSVKVSGNLMTGFYLVLYAWYWLWRNFDRQKLINHTDIRCYHLIQKAATRIVPAAHRRIWRLRNGEVRTSVDGTEVAVIDSHPSFLWLLKHDRYMTWGLWMLLFLGCWLFSSFAWMPAVFDRRLEIGLPVIVSWLIEFCITFFWISRQVKTPIRLPYCIVMPLYLLAFPVLLVHARLS